MFARFSRNSLYLTLARLGTQLGLALFTILLARQLGTQAFGEYAFIAALIVVGNTVTTFGTDMYLIREIAASADDSLLSAALWLQLLLSALFALGVLVLSAWFRGLSPEAIVAIRIYSVSLFPLAFFTVHTTALRGRQRMLEYSLLNLALIAFQVGSVFALIRFHGGLILLSVLLLLVQCLAALVAGLLARSRIRLLPAPASLPPQVVRLATASAAIAVLSIIGILYQRLALLLLPSLAGAQVTGWYSAAARLVEAAKMGHIAAFTAIYPLMSQARSARPSEFARSFRAPWWLLLALAVFGAVGLSIFAAPLIALLFGSAYAASVQLLRILAWMLIPYSVNGFLTLVFLARGQTTPILRALGGSTLTLAVLTFWLVPVMGAPAAALSALSAEIVQSLLLALHYGRLTRPLPVPQEPQLGLPAQS